MKYENQATSSYLDPTWIEITSPKQNIIIGCIYRSGTPTTAAYHDNNLHVINHINESHPNFNIYCNRKRFKSTTNCIR